MYFNPRPREEGDRHLIISDCADRDFNPRPREEGDLFIFKGVFRLADFNPRPREEGDYFSICASAVNVISIHALVKRAT